MKKIYALKKLMILIGAVMIFTACSQKQSGDMVLISTEYGDIKVKLYDETPLHKENFLKLVDQGYYNDQLFHRVIEGFMIQGGDPESIGATADQQLGNGGPGYTIPAEIVSTLYHKKGVLAAARMGDQVNPEKESSGSQFYLVQGKVYTDEELDNLELRNHSMARRTAFGEYMELPESADLRTELKTLQEAGKTDELNAKLLALEPELDKRISDSQWKIPANIREDYTTIGGTPALDNQYTVFGEVVEGLAVIDSIAAVQTNAVDRPVADVKMTMKRVKK